MERRGVMAPPEAPRSRGLMAIDPEVAAAGDPEVELRMFLWAVAGVLAATLYVAHSLP
jgi:hypothetical protein